MEEIAKIAKIKGGDKLTSLCLCFYKSPYSSTKKCLVLKVMAYGAGLPHQPC